MGYYGLENMNCSDTAMEEYSMLLDIMKDHLENALVEPSNKYNTSGCVNVALLIESELFQGIPKEDREGFYDVIIKTEKELGFLLTIIQSNSNYKKDKNLKYHYKNHKRMLASLKKWRGQK